MCVIFPHAAGTLNKLFKRCKQTSTRTLSGRHVFLFFQGCTGCYLCSRTNITPLTKKTLDHRCCESYMSHFSRRLSKKVASKIEWGKRSLSFVLKCSRKSPLQKLLTTQWEIMVNKQMQWGLDNMLNMKQKHLTSICYK